MVETSFGSGRDILTGIARYVLEHKPWLLFHEARSIDQKLPGWLRNRKVYSIMARVLTPAMAAALRGTRPPVVDVLGVVPDAGLMLPAILPFLFFALALGARVKAQETANVDEIRERTRALCGLLLPQSEQHTLTVEISTPKLITQQPGQPWPTGLGPIWYVAVQLGGLGRGHFMFEPDAKSQLHEFALDTPLPIPPRKGTQLEKVPNLQQFPVTGVQNPTVASGCVPTSAACLIGYWAEHKFPQWNHLASKTAADGFTGALKNATMRLRARMRMLEITDRSGYTDDNTALSGAFPEDLAEALRVDAEEYRVPVRVELAKFEPARLREELLSSRPALVSCVVRLPHKPHLSWGHEILAVGWQSIEEVGYVGVRDNFFPSQHEPTVRWIRDDVFQSMVLIAPAD